MRCPVTYPVTVETRLPARFDRVQLLVRMLVLSVIGVLHQTTGGLLGALYLALPVIVTVLLVQKGRSRFLSEDVRWLVAVLEWVVAVYAYLLFVTDRFPLPSNERAVRVVVRSDATPTAGRAALRLVTSVPHAIVLAILGIAASLIGFVAAVSILLVERYPEALWTFQRDVLAWMTRLFAYHSSLVDTYPPFSLGTADAVPPRHQGRVAPPL